MIAKFQFSCKKFNKQFCEAHIELASLTSCQILLRKESR